MNRLVPAVVVLVVGVATTASVTMYLHTEETQHLSSAVDHEMEFAATEVAAGLRRYVDAQQALAMAVGAQSELTPQDFATITSSLVDQDLPGAVSISFAVPASGDEIAATEAKWRANNPELRLDPDGYGRDHRFVVLRRDLEAAMAPLGRDVSQTVPVVQAMDTARADRRIVGSQSFVLSRDRALSEQAQQRSFVLVAPVFGGGTSDDAGQFRGWLNIAVRSHDFAAGVLSRTEDRDVNVTVNEPSGTELSELTALINGKTVSGFDRHSTVDLAGQTWQLTVAPTVALATHADADVDTAVAFLGFVISLLMAGLVWMLSNGRRHALMQVERATAQLQADVARRVEVEAQLRVAARQADERRHANDELLNGISELGVGVAIIDGQKFKFVNQAMSNLSGYSEAELLAMPSHMTLLQQQDRDEWKERIADIEQGESMTSAREALLVHKTGDEVPVEIVSKLVHVDDRVQRLGIIRDIRARRDMENALAAHAKALAATNAELVELETMRADFLAAVTHDFRTPLTAMLGYVELALVSDDETGLGELRMYLDRAINAARELNRRVDTFLDFSRAERVGVELELTTVSLRAELLDILNEMTLVLGRNPMNVHLVDADVVIDKRAFKRVIENLLTNAVKYAPEGSMIDVRVSIDGERANVYVEDRGMGIAPENLDRVFDSYFRSRDVRGVVRGSGIGLTVVRQLVEAMNGRVWVTNRDEGGSSFCVSLLLAPLGALSSAFAIASTPRRYGAEQ